MTDDTKTPGQLLFEELDINLDTVTVDKLHYYTAVEYFLTIEDEPSSDASNLDKVKRYLESFHHLCEVEDWNKAIDVINIRLNSTTNVKLHHQLTYWGYYNEGIIIANKLLQKLNKKQDVSCLNILGYIYNSLGNYDKATQVLQKSLTIAKKIKYKLGKLESVVFLGETYKCLGQYNEALQKFQEHSVIAEELNKTAGISTNEIPSFSHYNAQGAPEPLMGLGNVYDSLGEYDKAIKYYLKAWEVVKNSDNRVGQAQVSNNLGNSYTSKREYNEAIKWLNQSLNIAREIGLRSCETLALGNLGIFYKSIEDYDKAIERLEQSLSVADEINDVQSIVIYENHLGDTYTSKRQYGTAIIYIKQSFTNAKKIGDKLGQVNSLSALVNIYQLRGEYHNAIQTNKMSLPIIREMGDTKREVASLNLMAVLILMLNRKEYFQKIIPFWSKSLVLAIKNRRFDLLVISALTLLMILGLVSFIVSKQKKIIVYPFTMTLGLYLSWILSNNLEYQFIYVIIGMLASIYITYITLQIKRPKFYYTRQEIERYSQEAQRLFDRLTELRNSSSYDYQKIKSQFEEIYLQYPEDMDICFAYTTLLDWHEENEIAIPILEKALKYSFCYQHSLTAQLAWAIVDKGEYKDLNRAKCLINKVIKLEPENHCFFDTLAWIEYRKENYKQALKLIKKTIISNPSNPEIYYHAGKIYFKLGNKQKSKEYIKKSLSFDRAFSGYQDASELLSN